MRNRHGFLRIARYSKPRVGPCSGGYAECKEHPDENYIEDDSDFVEEKNEPVIISDCCGVEDRDTCENGASFRDIGICPDCKEHCEFVEE